MAQRFFSLAFFALALGLILFGCVSSPSTPQAGSSFFASIENQSQAVAQNFSENAAVVLQVDLGNGTVLEKKVLVKIGASAFDAFNASFGLSSVDYGPGLGAYVRGIEGVMENEGGNGLYWQYYSDSKLVSVGASAFAITQNTTIVFKYEKPNFNYS